MQGEVSQLQQLIQDKQAHDERRRAELANLVSPPHSDVPKVSNAVYTDEMLNASHRDILDQHLPHSSVAIP